MGLDLKSPPTFKDGGVESYQGLVCIVPLGLYAAFAFDGMCGVMCKTVLLHHYTEVARMRHTKETNTI